MMEKLVILSSRFPYPLTKGDKLRLYYQIIELSKFFSIHLVCINSEIPSKLAFQALEPYTTSIRIHVLRNKRSRFNMGRYYWTKMPLQIRHFYDKQIHQDILRDLQLLKPKYVFAQLVRVAPYVIGIDANIPKGIDLMDSMILNDLAGQYLTKYYTRIFRDRERRLIRAYENNIAPMFDDHFVISERDKKMLPDEIRSKVVIVSNGVEFDANDQSDYDYKNKDFDIVFCGNLSYQPNIEAARYLAQSIMPLLPQLRCLIAGAEPGKLKKELASENVEIRGYQEDLRAIYEAGKIMVVPIFSGSGQQNKVLEAMSFGTPCIVSPFVNDAIMATDGVEVLVANDVSMFIEHIKSLISHSEFRQSIGIAALTFIKARFNWSKNTMPLIMRIKESLKR